MSLVLSCFVLVWGIARLARIVHKLSTMLVNKGMIVSHIVAYLFIIVANTVQTLYYVKNPGFRAYEISTICNMAIYFVCTLIFGLIVNTIVTKIIAAEIPDSQSIATSLMTGSISTRRATEERFYSEKSA